MPYFSITIPVYNVEDYLEKCINSVIEQSYQDFEIIIIDDGSTDLSGSICDNYAKHFDNIKVIHKQNEGLLLARRAALQYVSGKVVLFLDSDDYWDKELLQNVYDAMEEYHCDMVMYRCQCVDQNNKYLFSQKALLPDLTVIYDATKFVLGNLATTYEYNSMCMKAVKKECIDIESDYFQYKGLSMGEDALQSVPIARKIQSFVYLDKILYNYRINAQGMTRNISEKYLDDYMNVRRKIITNICEVGMCDEQMVSRTNEYTLRGFFSFLADFARKKDNKAKWKKVYARVIKEYRKFLLTAKKKTIKGTFYECCLAIGNFEIYKILGKIKGILLKIYNMSLR